jgi:hypothetical protein
MRKLLDELALAEQAHGDLAGKLNFVLEESGARKAEDQTHRLACLPGCAIKRQSPMPKISYENRSRLIAYGAA